MYSVILLTVLMDREEKNLESRLDLDGALSCQGQLAVKCKLQPGNIDNPDIVNVAVLCHRIYRS
jgi:hypothetical protein